MLQGSCVFFPLLFIVGMLLEVGCLKLPGDEGPHLQSCLGGPGIAGEKAAFRAVIMNVLLGDSPKQVKRFNR